MSLLNFVKFEFSGWGKYERVFFPLGILTIILISLSLNDNKIALVSAVCGISYTILAGKGKISCYAIGMVGTLCYSWLSFKNAFWGNLALYLLYYFPMEIVGIFKWKKHLKKDTKVIEKTYLSNRERLILCVPAIVGTLGVGWLLKHYADATPFVDAFTTVFSILGMYLTVKRCIEQWVVWLLVNAFACVMWIGAYLNGSNCFATILMWVVYLALAVYFWLEWKKELSDKIVNY